MMLPHKLLACLILIACTIHTDPAVAQESTKLTDRIFNFPDEFFHAGNQKSQVTKDRLAKSTFKYLNKLQKRELKMKRRLAKKNSNAAKEIFSDVSPAYAALVKKMSDSLGKLHPLTNDYNGHLDSLKTALGFLQSENVLSKSPLMQGKYKDILNQYSALQHKLNQTHAIQKLLGERQKYLQERLQSFGLAKELRKYKEQLYYYRAQIEEYKNIFNHPDKWESKLLGVATKIPAFARFFSRHSELASIFRLPNAEIAPSASLQGLQTRAVLADELNNRFGRGFSVSQAVNTGIRDAQPGLNIKKEQFGDLGNAGDDMAMPNFKPNSQKSKSFLKRLELGTNMQSTRSNNFFPTTTDFGFSVGYKINTKSVFGVGTSYKMGWGKDIRHIAITHQGIGLRSFLDVKLKGSFWLTGGGELNYRTQFEQIDQLKNYKDWQPSALAGLSKKYQIKNKLKGNVQLLYDFLYARQFPRTQSVLFRIGYSLN